MNRHWALLLRFPLLACACGPLCHAPGQTLNSWTNTAGGAWPAPANWSAGAPPASTYSLVLITNANTKTVQLGDGRVLTATKTVSNLVVSGPKGTVNTLQLDTMGTPNQLEVLNGLDINAGGELLLASSVTGRVSGVSGGGLEVDGSVRLASGVLITSNTFAHIGTSSRGTLSVEGAAWYAKEVSLGYLLGGFGALTQASGNVMLSGELRIAPANTSTGVVSVTAGQLTVTNANTYVGLYANGFGTMNLTNALWQARDVYVGYYGGSQGTLNLSGGTQQIVGGLTLAQSAGANARGFVSGGQLFLTNAGTSRLTVGAGGKALLTLRSNIWQAQEAFIGRNNGSDGDLWLEGATGLVSGSLVLGDNVGSTGLVVAADSVLLVTNTDRTARLEIGRAGRGSFDFEGGTIVADRFIATNRAAGSYFYFQGGDLVTRYTDLRSTSVNGGTWQMLGGSHRVESVNVNLGTVTVLDAQLSGSFNVGPMAGATMLVSNVSWTSGDVMIGTMGAGTDHLSLLDSACTLGTVLVSGADYVRGPANLLALGGQFSARLLKVGMSDLGPGHAAFSNTVWRAGAVEVANEAPSPREGLLELSGSSGVISNQLLICTVNNIPGGTVSLFSGNLAVTNAAGTGLVKIAGKGLAGAGIGLLRLLGGTLAADQLVVSNTYPDPLYQPGALELRSGTLSTRSAQMFDPRMVSFGGSNCPPALWVMQDGLHHFRTEPLIPGWMTPTRLSLGSEPASTGMVYLASGVLLTTNVVTRIGDAGSGVMTISNGTWRAGSVLAGCSNGASGTLNVHGGLVSISTNLSLGAGGCGSSGSMLMTGGTLGVTNTAHDATLEVRSGGVTLSNGLLVADRLVLTNACGRFVRYGGTLQASQIVLDPNLSATGDGIPNSWKQYYGFDPFLWNVADLDPDHDGMSNLAEYLSGTNPTNAGSVLRIISARLVGQNVEVVSQVGAGAHTFYLQSAPALAGGAVFQDTGVSNRLRPLRDYTFTNWHIGGATQAARFYRLRQGP